MEEILKMLYGDAVTEESLAKFREELGKRFVPKADFNQRGEELKMLREKLSAAEEKIVAGEHFEQENQSLAGELSMLREVYERDMEAAKVKEAEIHLQHAVERALVQEKARNLVAVRALLNMEGITLENGQLVGFDEQIEQLKQENGYLFEKSAEVINFMRPTGGDTVMTEEEFQKLGYMEKLKLKKEQPDVYQKFTKFSGGKNLWQRI